MKIQVISIQVISIQVNSFQLISIQVNSFQVISTCIIYIVRYILFKVSNFILEILQSKTLLLTNVDKKIVKNSF